MAQGLPSLVQHTGLAEAEVSQTRSDPLPLRDCGIHEPWEKTLGFSADREGSPDCWGAPAGRSPGLTTHQCPPALHPFWAADRTVGRTGWALSAPPHMTAEFTSAHHGQQHVFRQHHSSPGIQGSSPREAYSAFLLWSPGPHQGRWPSTALRLHVQPYGLVPTMHWALGLPPTC